MGGAGCPGFQAVEVGGAGGPGAPRVNTTAQEDELGGEDGGENGIWLRTRNRCIL